MSSEDGYIDTDDDPNEPIVDEDWHESDDDED